MQGTNRGGDGGRTCYVAPDLSYDWEGREKMKGEDNGWDDVKNSAVSI